MKFPTYKDFIYWFIGLGILLIYFIVKKVTKNEGLVEYISFGGTLVSIILAVLAIVYAYLQSMQSSKNYTDSQIIMNKISQKIESIDEINLNVHNSNIAITDIKQTLADKMRNEIKYLNITEEQLEKLIQKQVPYERIKGTQDFQVVMTAKVYDYKNPKIINGDEEFKKYIEYYRRVTGSNDGLAFNVDTSAHYLSYSFNMTVSNPNITEDILKGILMGCPDENFKVFTVAKLTYSKI